MINIYATTWCPHCTKTVDFLNEKNIKFQWHDMEKQPEDVVKKVVEVNGGDDWVVPTIEYNGQWRKGQFFNPEKLMTDLKNMGAI